MPRLPWAGLVRLAFHEEDQDQGHGGLLSLSELGVLPSMIRNHHQLFNEDRDSEIINKNLSCLLESMSERLLLNNLVISKKKSAVTPFTYNVGGSIFDKNIPAVD